MYATLKRESVFAFKDVVAMVGLLPYMAYARAGRFAPPFGLSDDHVHRIGSGFDLHPIPNVTLTMQTRWGIPAGGAEDAIPDMILFMRWWL